MEPCSEGSGDDLELSAMQASGLDLSEGPSSSFSARRDGMST